MMDRIAFVKTGWAEDYQGEEVVGRHAHIGAFREAHERFNFKKAPDGRFYGYIHPIGQNESCPRPLETDNWLLIVVSARNGNGPLTVVGFYENASFEADYVERPEYGVGDFELDVHGNPYAYCFSADKATLISLEDRDITIPGDHIKRTPIVYVRGNRQNEKWRKDLAALAERIVKAAVKKPAKKKVGLAFPDQAHKDAVEEASIKAARAFFKKHLPEHRETDRQSDNCGYDFLLSASKPKDELHIEVKGTSSADMQFYLTRNEFGYLKNPRWRLLMVTDALGKPKCRLMDYKEVLSIFDLSPFAWRAVEK